jgi:hypothetical protein
VKEVFLSGFSGKGDAAVSRHACLSREMVVVSPPRTLFPVQAVLNSTCESPSEAISKRPSSAHQGLRSSPNYTPMQPGDGKNVRDLPSLPKRINPCPDILQSGEHRPSVS